MSQKNCQKVAKLAKSRQNGKKRQSGASACGAGPKGPELVGIYIILVTTLRPASPGYATWLFGGFGVFCHFGNFLPIWRFWQLFGDFLAHFDPWTICDNSLQ